MTTTAVAGLQYKAVNAAAMALAASAATAVVPAALGVLSALLNGRQSKTYNY